MAYLKICKIIYTVLSSELPGFWTLSIVRNSKYTRKHNVSETGPPLVLLQGDTSSVLHLRTETDPVSKRCVF
jgi:hypothetical protein